MNHFILNLLEIEQFNSSVFYSSTMCFKDLNKTARLTSRASAVDEEGYQREFNKNRLKNIIEYIEESMEIEDYDMPIFPTPIVLSIESDSEMNESLKEQLGDKKLEDCIDDISSFFDKQNSQFYKVIENKKINNIDLKKLNTAIKKDEDKYSIEKKDNERKVLIEKKSLSKEEIDILTNIPIPALIENKLLVPYIEKSFFIVDGQHRFKAMQKLYERLIDEKSKSLLDRGLIEKKINRLENFRFVVSILLDFDLYQQSRVFANINFNQKSVNRSLYYDIFGSIYREKDELTFTHFLAKTFNESNEFQNIIKMLGSGSGTISLAFFVETILDNLINSSLKKYVDEYIDETGLLYLSIPDFLINYFTYIKDKLPKHFPPVEFVEEEKNGQTSVVKNFKSSQYKKFLFKTTGIYGLLNLINDLFLMNSNLFILDKNELYTFLDKSIDNNKLKKVLENTNYYKTAGKSLQKSFYGDLRDCLIKKDN